MKIRRMKTKLVERPEIEFKRITKKKVSEFKIVRKKSLTKVNEEFLYND